MGAKIGFLLEGNFIVGMRMHRVKFSGRQSFLGNCNFSMLSNLELQDRPLTHGCKFDKIS
jgi:hypothetical protein